MPVLEFYFKPSIRYQCLWSFVCLGSCFSIGSLTLAWHYRLIALIMLVLYGGWVWWKDILLKRKESIVAISMNSNQQWQLHFHNKKIVHATLQSKGVTLTSFFCVLRWNTCIDSKQKTMVCIVFCDALSNQSYRQLLVMMRTLSS